MKKKLLLKAMAVTMSALCLAGCSQPPAAEVVTSGAETQVDNSSSITESSVIETESSETETEAQVEKDITEVAKSYGMTQVSDQQELLNLWGGFDSSSVYYAAKDSNEAASMYFSLVNQDAKSFPDVKATELVVCIDKKSADSKGKSTTSEIYKITVADNASAQELYEAFAQKKDTYSYSSGTANGYTYTIGFYESTKNCVAVGTFVKDNVVIRMTSMGEYETADKCLSFFCKEMGFESPMALK